MQSLKRQTVGHYVLQKKLSCKAGRQTFVAKDLNTQTPVVVKILQIDSDFKWDELKLFKREGQILQQLDYPAIPSYRDSFEAKVDGVSSFVLVQDYIAAKSLQEIVETGELFSEAEAIAIASQLLTTLSYLHQQHPPVIHRDIKPSNILISDPSPKATANLEGVIERRVYLVDFGAVQVTASKTSGTVTIVGSYGYMPLEQFLGHTTPASDLYSLGMLLLYLVTGMHPAELPEKDGRVQLEQIGAAAGLSDRFIHWLSQLTKPYAEQRFKSAAVALTVLNAKDGENGYFPHLQPADHHIHIHRQPNQLTLISATLSKFNESSSLTSLLAWPCFMIAFHGLAIAYPTIGVLGLLALALLFIIFCIVYYRIHKGVKRYTFVSINNKGISAGIAKGKSIRSLHTFKKKQRFLLRSSINFVSYSPKHTFRKFYDGKRKISDRNQTGPCNISLPATLSIHTTTGCKYTLFCDNLSIEEQRWINKEIEDFLGLSLQTIAKAYSFHPQASQIRTIEQQQSYEKVRRKNQF